MFHVFRSRRTGKVVVLFAILSPALLALMAMAIDYAVIVLSRQQLQNAADAGALAGALELSRNPKGALIVAQATIQTNRVMGRDILVDMTQDVDYGKWDSKAATFTPQPSPTGANAVRARLEQSAARGTAAPLFLGVFLGRNTADIKAEAIASTTSDCSGFIGLESATLLNNCYTDSFDSSLGPYSAGAAQPQGDVCSNGPIYMASGADIFGDARHGPNDSFTIAGGSGATISGTAMPLSRPIVKDPVSFAIPMSSNNNANIPLGPAWNPFFYLPSGDLVIDNGRNLTLSAGDYYFKNVHLAGGCTLTISGQVRFYVENALTFDNGTFANLSQRPVDFQLFVGAGPVNIQGGNRMHGVIYAPTADVFLANGTDFFGTIVGKTLNLAGGMGCHFDESLRDANTTPKTPQLVK